MAAFTPVCGGVSRFDSGWRHGGRPLGVPVSKGKIMSSGMPEDEFLIIVGRTAWVRPEYFYVPWCSAPSAARDLADACRKVGPVGPSLAAFADGGHSTVAQLEADIRNFMREHEEMRWELREVWGYMLRVLEGMGAEYYAPFPG